MSLIRAYPCLEPPARLVSIRTDASPARRSTSWPPAPRRSSSPGAIQPPPTTAANISANVVDTRPDDVYQRRSAVLLPDEGREPGIGRTRPEQRFGSARGHGTRDRGGRTADRGRHHAPDVCDLVPGDRR